MPVCEIMSVGTELLLGQILNTNSQFLAQELAVLGINCFYQTTVGDNRQRIVQTIREALNRSDILLITGGLGPTADDLTTECLSEAFGQPLVHDQATLEYIAEFFKQRGYEMPPSNRKQALRPQGSEILINRRGTAPGCIWSIHDSAVLKLGGMSDIHRERLVMTFPGVPSEMKAMWSEVAAPYLVNKFGQQVLWSCDLKHYGIGESALAEKYAHLLDLANPTVAPYAGRGECRLRVTARAETVEDAQKLAQPIIDEIRTNSGSLCYGRDKDTLEQIVGTLLTQQKLTVSVAESCTGGLVSKRLTDISGSSAYVKLNVVTYANQVKQQMLKVEQHVLDNQGAVSEECAAQMATGIKSVGGADIGLSTTGIAGPTGGSEEKPVGLVYIGLDNGRRVIVKRFSYPSHLPRDEIRFRTASDALNMLRLSLQS